jgi:hypothetical protein
MLRLCNKLEGKTLGRVRRQGEAHCHSVREFGGRTKRTGESQTRETWNVEAAYRDGSRYVFDF